MICKNSHDMQNLIRVADAITTTIFRALDWFYLTLILFFLGLAVWLALGPHGSRCSARLAGEPGENQQVSLPQRSGLKRARHPLKRRRDAIRRLVGVLGNASPQS
jgi:hypothetical protein